MINNIINIDMMKQSCSASVI